MKKLVFTLLIVFASGMMFSCSDPYAEEFIELQSDQIKSTGGGAGGPDHKGKPE